MIGGNPVRTYVNGDTRFAISSASGRGILPNQRAAAACRLGPSITSGTSVTPNQFTTAATLGTGGSAGGVAGAGAAAGAGPAAAPRPPPAAGGAAAPAHSFPRPALSGIIPIASARCPPADSPVTTMRLLSML